MGRYQTLHAALRPRYWASLVAGSSGASVPLWAPSSVGGCSGMNARVMAAAGRARSRWRRSWPRTCRPRTLIWRRWRERTLRRCRAGWRRADLRYRVCRARALCAHRRRRRARGLTRGCLSRTVLARAGFFGRAHRTHCLPDRPTRPTMVCPRAIPLCQARHIHSQRRRIHRPNATVQAHRSGRQRPCQAERQILEARRPRSTL